LNVHRWRKLEGSDPATFELIQKIQTLQRRLIAKTEEVNHSIALDILTLTVFVNAGGGERVGNPREG
jgi:hypothetical protein